MLPFKILPKKITPKVTLAKSSLTYNGKDQKPTITVKDGDKTIKSTDYTATYASGRKNVGKYWVKIKLKNNYIGEATINFKIVPKGTSLGTMKRAKKAITVKWKKQSAKMSTSRITGYEIQLATNSSFTKNKKTVTVKGYKSTSKKVKKLKGKKKYYVRVRTYKKVSGATYKSPWSKTKTIKTK